jgi:hypothetical protein
LTASKNVGLLAATQAGAAAAAAAGGSIYVLSLDQVYNRLVSAKLATSSQVPNIDSIQVVGDAPNGGVAAVVMLAAAAGPGRVTVPGSKAYPLAGYSSQQLVATVTSTVCDLKDLTAGTVTVNVFYIILE